MRSICIFIFCCTSAVAFSQIEDINDKSRFFERVYFGGGVNIAFDQYLAIIGASPSIGFMVTPSTSIGTGITYQYIQFRDTGENGNIFGYRIFARQNLYAQFFAYTEYENLGFKSYLDESRNWNSRAHIGGGYFQAISKRAGFQALILYRISENRAVNQFSSPWSYRAGFTFSPF